MTATTNCSLSIYTLVQILCRRNTQRFSSTWLSSNISMQEIDLTVNAITAAPDVTANKYDSTGSSGWRHSVSHVRSTRPPPALQLVRRPNRTWAVNCNGESDHQTFVRRRVDWRRQKPEKNGAGNCLSFSSCWYDVEGAIWQTGRQPVADAWNQCDVVAGQSNRIITVNYCRDT